MSDLRPILFAAATGAILGAGLYGCSHARAAELGLASWYSGGGTFCGDRVVQPFTAAHKSLPCNAVVRVTTIAREEHQGVHARLRGLLRRRPDAGRSVTVTVRDRGPFPPGRIIDLDPTAGAALGLVGPGVLPVTVERIR
jgi:rare lipoprotein A